MAKLVIALLLVATFCAVAQQADARGKFAGTWEAKWKDRVICTIRLKPGDPISGEMQSCSIHVDPNGDLMEPETTEDPDGPPEAILRPKLKGEMLSFEEEDGSDVIKFELKLVGEGKAELRIQGSPVRINPIPFTRK